MIALIIITLALCTLLLVYLYKCYKKSNLKYNQLQNEYNQLHNKNEMLNISLTEKVDENEVLLMEIDLLKSIYKSKLLSMHYSTNQHTKVG